MRSFPIRSYTGGDVPMTRPTIDEAVLNEAHSQGKADGRADAEAATAPEPRDRPHQDGLSDRDYAYLLGYTLGWNEVLDEMELAEQGGC